MDQRNQASGIRSTAGFWLFLIWLITCLFLFFWKIPPHPIQSFLYLIYSFKYSEWTWPSVLTAWIHHGLFLISFIGTFLVFSRTGNHLLQWIRPENWIHLETWVWSLALGFGFWGLLAESLAFENILYPVLLKALMILALTVFLLFERKKAFQGCWPFIGKLEMPSFWLWPLAVVILLSLSNLLAPEMSWDAITYQLILPKFYLMKHGFYPVTGIVPAHYPSLGQMIFSWGLLWNDDSLARSFGFLAHLGTALALVSIGSRLLTPKIGWTAGIFYWVFPYLNIFSTRGYVDLFVGFYSVLGLGYLMVFKKSGNNIENNSWGMLAVTALGFIWAIKYNAVSFWLAGILLFHVAAKGYKTNLPTAVWLWGTPLFFFGPWALKSLVYTSNPIYPHLSGLFHTFDWTAFDAKTSAIKFHVEGLEGLAKLPSMVWKIVFENYAGAPNEEVSLVPLVLLPVLLTLLVFKWRELRWKWPFLVAIGIPFFFWLITTHQLRLISGTIALASIPLAVAYQWAVNRRAPFERILNVLMGGVFWVCTFYLFQGLANQPTPFACSLGFQTRDEFLSRVLRPEGYVSVANTLNQTLPSDARVLIIGQQNGYYLDRISSYDFDYTYPVLKKWSEKSSSPEELYRKFKENGFTHILYNANAMLGTAIRVDELGVDRYPWTPLELKNYEQFFLKFTRKIPLPVGNGYSLYEVRPREGFSDLPDFLPGTERYYVKNMQEVMGLPRVSDLVGKPIPSDVYLQTYLRVSNQYPEIGLPCFQSAFGTLGVSPADTRQALQMGRKGFERNGDESAWDALQGDYCLAQKKTSQAVTFLERAQHLSPEREDVARNLAVAYYNEHNLQKAVEEADRAVALAPFSQEYQELAQQLQSLMKR